MTTPRQQSRLRRTVAVVRIAGLAAVVSSVVRDLPAHDTPRLVVAVTASALAVLGWVGWLGASSAGDVANGLFDWGAPRETGRPLPHAVLAPALALLGVGGGIATGMLPGSAAPTFPFVAVVVAGGALSSRLAIGVVAATVLTTVVAIPLGPDGAGAAAAYGAGLLAASLAGANRAQSAARAEANELLLAETQRAASEREHAAALEERGRIAREVHDVLAHALAGLGIQLEAAHLLLAGGRADEAALHVTRAQDLTREGIAETRRALHALRGEPVDLHDVLEAQLAAYREDSGGRADLALALARPVSPEAGVAVARVTQEVLTNARRHAPGADVAVSLRSDAAGVHLELTDTGPASGRTPAAEGSGYGLLGIRERAALAGGSVTAGSHGPGWRVCLTLPA